MGRSKKPRKGRFGFEVPKSWEALAEDASRRADKSLSEYLRDALAAQLQRDGFTVPPPDPPRKAGRPRQEKKDE